MLKTILSKKTVLLATATLIGGIAGVALKFDQDFFEWLTLGSALLQALQRGWTVRQEVVQQTITQGD